MNDEFYGSARWKRKARKILRRDKYQCQLCKRYGRISEAKVVHHKIELEDDPSLAFEDDNLISLCKSCHNKVHGEKGTRANRKRRYERGNYNDPYGG